MPLREAGQVLRAWRMKTGLNQRQFAECLGLDYYTKISNYETGQQKVPTHQFAAYSAALKVDSGVFSRILLAYYDPALYRALFGADGKAGTGEINSLEARITELENQLNALDGRDGGGIVADNVTPLHTVAG